jgi:GNAT superfamily N-acetyltransferase
MTTITYRSGYMPGLIGWMIATQTQYYAGHVGFGMPFELTVGAGLLEYAPRSAEPGNLLLSAWEGDTPVGSIVIDGGTQPPARLRWFVVSPKMHGRGVGSRLLADALVHADRFHECVWLTTIADLDAAIHLYRKTGFVMTDQHDDATWGPVMREQRWERRRAVPR